MKILELYNAYAARTAALLASICTVCVFAYGILLLMAVAHATHLSAVQHQISSLTTKLSAAENIYLKETQSLTMASATALGLGKPSSVVIVYAAEPSSLSFNR